MNATAYAFLFGFVALAVFAPFGAWVAGQKHRSRLEGYFLGVLFNALGVVVEGLLPNQTPRGNADEYVPTPLLALLGLVLASVLALAVFVVNNQ